MPEEEPIGEVQRIDEGEGHSFFIFGNQQKETNTDFYITY